MSLKKAALAIAVSIGTFAFAATPPATMSYQAMLRTPGGGPLSGTFDMVFTLYSASVSGEQILVDSHTAGGGSPVTVENGLLTVALGSGSVSDGSGAGTYTSLDGVFRDYGTVYLALNIGGEPLSPRTEIVSAAFALNADHVDGLDGSQLMRSDVATTATGSITLDTTTVLSGGGLDLGVGGSDDLTAADVTTLTNGGAADTLHTHVGLDAGTVDGLNGTQFLRSDAADTAAGRMTFTGVATGTGVSQGSVSINPATSGGYGFTLFGVGAGGVPSFKVTSNWVRVDTELVLNGTLWMDTTGPDADQNIFFYNAGTSNTESFGWDDSENSFKFTDAASFSGAIRTGSYTSTDYNHFGSSGAPDSGIITSDTDVYIADDLEVDSDVFLNGSLFMDDDGPNGDQFIYFYDASDKSDESLKWDDTSDRFEFTNDMVFFGSVKSTGTKSIVQNHPEDSTKSIAYVALEGDEAGTYTRGSGRLIAGEALIALGSTYRLTTNPDIGLTAHLTARGECPNLYVESVTTSELVVRQMGGLSDDCAFDFAVMGLRLGWEEQPVVAARQEEAPVPTSAYWDRLHAAAPQLRELTALERHRRNAIEAFGQAPDDLQASEALKDAVGRFNPDFDDIRQNEDHLPLGDERNETTTERVQPVPSQDDDKRAIATGWSPTPASASLAASPAISDNENITGRSFRPTAPDLASYQPVSETVELGDVLSVDLDQPGALRRATIDSDATVVGIVAADPGLALGGSPEHRRQVSVRLTEELNLARELGDLIEVARLETALDHIFNTNQAPVALSGIVRCKVDSSYGSILPGDLLVASNTPGHARSAANPAPGTVVGKALESMDIGTGLIRVLVMFR